MQCSGPREAPLILPAASEPSAKIHNDRGIQFYRQHQYMDALLQFIQASVADQTAGEIHFNIALALLHRGEEGKAIEHFKLARKYAQGNEMILKSPTLNHYLKP